MTEMNTGKQRMLCSGYKQRPAFCRKCLYFSKSSDSRNPPNIINSWGARVEVIHANGTMISLFKCYKTSALF